MRSIARRWSKRGCSYIGPWVIRKLPTQLYTCVCIFLTFVFVHRSRTRTLVSLENPLSHSLSICIFVLECVWSVHTGSKVGERIPLGAVRHLAVASARLRLDPAMTFLRLRLARGRSCYESPRLVVDIHIPLHTAAPPIHPIVTGSSVASQPPTYMNEWKERPG